VATAEETENNKPTTPEIHIEELIENNKKATL
jgi:hypothetical protein